MVMRVGGLASGMDIDALVEKLMQAERAPLDKLQQKKTTYEWQRDAYRGVNTKLKALDTYIADNMILKSLNAKAATSSNSKLVDVKATGSANGALSIEGVSQLADAARVVGEQKNITKNMKMSDVLAGTADRTIEIKSIGADGKMPAEGTKIEITDNMTVDQFISKVNGSNAGVTAVFEGGRFSITAKNTGDNKAGQEIQIAQGTEIFEKLGFGFESNGSFEASSFKDGKNAVFTVNGIATERSTNTFNISGYQLTLKETFNNDVTIKEKYEAAKKELDNATAWSNTKKGDFATAVKDYFGAAFDNSTYETKFPKYSDSHNAAYKTAYGTTLSLSEQESYNALGKNFWNNLTSDEADFLKTTTKENFKADVEASSLSDEQKKKLTNLSEANVEVLLNNQDNATKFKERAQYETYGKKLATLEDEQLDFIKNSTLDFTKDLADIHTELDANTDLSDSTKTFLKSLTKEDLERVTTDTDNQVAKSKGNLQADTLKSISLAKLTDLTAEDLTAIKGLDFTKDKPLEDITDDKLLEKLKGLSKDQLEAVSKLEDSDIENFKNLKTQNENYTKFNATLNEGKAAEDRLANAENTLKIAKEDAEKAGILNADGTLNNVTSTAPPVTMSSTTNVDDMVTKIKEFVNTYNGFVKDLTAQTKESKYRDYAPLTAEQKKDMEESEIKLWEEKAKSGLLRNDSIVRNGLSNMRSLVYETHHGVSDPKYNSLYSIGITTSKTYSDGGTLEIDEKKLRAALEDNPDAVEQLFKNPGGKKEDTVEVTNRDGSVTTKTADTRGFLYQLRDSMKAFEVNIEKKAGRSTMTDNQYTIGKGIVDADKRIDAWQDKLKNIEARYWRQFSAMESAINKANSQSSIFAQG